MCVPRALNMPRSFLVKKVKLDDFSCAELESAYGRSRSDLNLRIHEKGKFKSLLTHSSCCAFCQLSTLYDIEDKCAEIGEKQNKALLYFKPKTLAH